MADGVEFKAMVEYMDYILSVVEKDGSTIARVFPDEADVLIHFADRIAVDVVG
jgi:recyclin-1